MPTLDGFCDLLEGDADWPAIMQALADVGYDGWATAEMVPPYQHAPDQLVYATSGAMDYIFDMGPQ
jgi:L-ribulose-5-phosphate 3-epimerase